MSDGVLLLASKPLGLRWFREIVSLEPRSLTAVITIDDRADVRSALDDIRRFGEECGVPVHVAPQREEADRILLEYAPRIAFCVSWYWFLPKRVLESVPLGILGVHFSLLPRYRGGSPLVWAIINGERESGVSLFTLTAKMDEGDIWAQRAFPIGEEEYIAEVLARAEEISVTILHESYRAIVAGELAPRPQTGEANVVPMRRPEDGRIDWNRSAREVFNFIRAQSRPYPGAFTDAGGTALRIWRARIADSAPEDELAFVCGDGRSIVVESSEPVA